MLSLQRNQDGLAVGRTATQAFRQEGLQTRVLLAQLLPKALDRNAQLTIQRWAHRRLGVSAVYVGTVLREVLVHEVRPPGSPIQRHPSCGPYDRSTDGVDVFQPLVCVEDRPGGLPVGFTAPIEGGTHELGRPAP